MPFTSPATPSISTAPSSCIKCLTHRSDGWPSEALTSSRHQPQSSSRPAVRRNAFIAVELAWAKIRKTTHTCIHRKSETPLKHHICAEVNNDADDDQEKKQQARARRADAGPGTSPLQEKSRVPKEVVNRRRARASRPGFGYNVRATVTTQFNFPAIRLHCFADYANS